MNKSDFDRWGTPQGMTQPICPSCGKPYSERPALSRKDNKTLICPECGMKEALKEWEEHQK